MLPDVHTMRVFLYSGDAPRRTSATRGRSRRGAGESRLMCVWACVCGWVAGAERRWSGLRMGVGVGGSICLSPLIEVAPLFSGAGVVVATAHATAPLRGICPSLAHASSVHRTQTHTPTHVDSLPVCSRALSTTTTTPRRARVPCLTSYPSPSHTHTRTHTQALCVELTRCTVHPPPPRVLTCEWWC